MGGRDMTTAADHRVTVALASLPLPPGCRFLIWHEPTGWVVGYGPRAPAGTALPDRASGVVVRGQPCWHVAVLAALTLRYLPEPGGYRPGWSGPAVAQPLRVETAPGVSVCGECWRTLTGTEPGDDVGAALADVLARSAALPPLDTAGMTLDAAVAATIRQVVHASPLRIDFDGFDPAETR